MVWMIGYLLMEINLLNMKVSSYLWRVASCWCAPLAGRHLCFLLLLFSLLPPPVLSQVPSLREIMQSRGDKKPRGDLEAVSFVFGSIRPQQHFFSCIGLFGWLCPVFSYFSLVCFSLGWRSPVVLFSGFCSLLGLRFFYRYF